MGGIREKVPGRGWREERDGGKLCKHLLNASYVSSFSVIGKDVAMNNNKGIGLCSNWG